MNYEFIITSGGQQQHSSNSYIGKNTILIKDCNIFDLPVCYNENRCSNDDEYCQPFIKGDIIFYQFPFDTNTYSEATFEIISSNTGLPVEGYCYNQFLDYPASTEQAQAQQQQSRIKYWNLRINTSESCGEIPDCFFIRIKLLKILDYGDPFDFLFSDPYCVVKCNEDTLLIEGVFTGYDCNNSYYGLYNGTYTVDGNVITYKNTFRVRGVIEPSGYEIEKTISGTLTNKSKKRNKFTLFTEKIPYYVAKQIANAFDSKQLLIDGVEYFGALKLDKNFEEGSDWIVKEELFTECAENNFTCE